MSNLSLIENIVKRVYDDHKNNQGGTVAQYIPGLANADPDPFAIAICTVHNEVVSIGDAHVPFTIQSISKPFVYGLALQCKGEEFVSKYVGTEPSGDAFNAIEVDPKFHYGYNPMVNAGALTMTGLVYDTFEEETDDRILGLFSDLAAEPLTVDTDMFHSELATAYRNKALCYFLQSVGKLDDPVDKKLEAYVRQCSIEVNAIQLARMAATLANQGTNPATDKLVLSVLTIRRLLSVMFTCGMYDFAGRWAVDVGIPAKSGVSGGIMAVVNRQIGLGLFSPRLDEYGNSVRATAACIHLAEELGLHAFEVSNIGSSVLDVYLGSHALKA